MSAAEINNWQDVQAEVLNRIHSRRWKPGDLIPNETELAREFGCARATVNRALRAVAEAGFLDRRRKAGTRVATHPVRKAVLSIPIIRQEIEAGNQAYSYRLLSRKVRKPPIGVRAQMNLPASCEALHVVALHLADNRPYVSEDRWINFQAVPDILNADLAALSANEWLVANAPFTGGDFVFSALKADRETAERLGVEPGDALFVIDRMTWTGETAITAVRLTYRPGYRMHSRV